jgi:hypothetical protein
MLLIFSLLIPAVLIALADWRKGIFLTVVVAFMQDPLRKLTPDQPVYFVVLAGIVFAASSASAFLRGIPLTLNIIPGWRRELRIPTLLFLLVLIIQAAVSLARYGNLMLPAIGMLFYLSPGLAMIIGYHFAIRKGIKGLNEWMRFYLVISIGFLTSVYLQYAGLDWPILGEVGIGQIIYDQGTILKAHSGFFRASEVAAWHTATAACFLFLTSMEKRLTLKRLVLAGLIVAFLVSIGMLTGRRKMVVQISIFIITYLGLFMFFTKQRIRFAYIVMVFGIFAFIIIVGLLGPDTLDKEYQKERYMLYVDRSRSVLDDIPQRFSNLGLAPVTWAIDRFGLFGAGLGIGSQGTQHFGGGAEVFGYASEGGLGKLTVELGIPGLVLSCWLLYKLFRLLWSNLQRVTGSSAKVARLSYGLYAFLIANIAAFIVATQAFGDLFIQLFLGLTLGFLLAMPTLADGEIKLQKTSKSPLTGSLHRGV